MNDELETIKEEIEKTQSFLDKKPILEKIKALNFLEKAKYFFQALIEMTKENQKKAEEDIKELEENKMFQQAGKVSRQIGKEEKYYLQQAAAEAEINDNLIEALRFYVLLADQEQIEYILSKIKEKGDKQILATAYLMVDKKDEYKKLLPALINQAKREKRYIDLAYYYQQIGKIDEAKKILEKIKEKILAKDDYPLLIQILTTLGDKKELKKIWQKYIEQSTLDEDYLQAALGQISIEDWPGLKETIMKLINFGQAEALYQIFFEIPMKQREEIFSPLIKNLKSVLPPINFITILNNLKQLDIKKEFIEEWINQFKKEEELKIKDIYFAIYLIVNQEIESPKIREIYQKFLTLNPLSLKKVKIVKDLKIKFYQGFIRYLLNEINNLFIE